MTATAAKSREYVDVAEVQDIVRRFEECSLSREEWDHRAHLAVAMWYLTHNDEATASDLMIRGICKFNHVKGISPSRRGGYHETLTLFWLGVGRRLVEAFPDCTPLEMVDRFLEMPKELAFRCYSEAVLWSDEARCHWLEPDVKSIDSLTEELLAQWRLTCAN